MSSEASLARTVRDGFMPGVTLKYLLNWIFLQATLDAGGPSWSGAVTTFWDMRDHNNAAAIRHEGLPGPGTALGARGEWGGGLHLSARYQMLGCGLPVTASE